MSPLPSPSFEVPITQLLNLWTTKLNPPHKEYRPLQLLVTCLIETHT
jgi:hypothetical protein